MDRQDYDRIEILMMKMSKYQFRYIRHEVDKANLYKGDPRLIMAIAGNEGCTQAELAKMLCIKPATLTVMIKRIESAGLIERRMDEKDLRLLRVYVTPKGREIAEKTEEILRKAVCRIFEGIDDEELAIYEKVVTEILQRMKSCLEKEEKMEKVTEDGNDLSEKQ